MSARPPKAVRQSIIEQSHFSQRVRERLWPVFGQIDPIEFFEVVKASILHGDERLSYVCRISRDGKRLWRIEAPPKGHFYVVARQEDDRVFPITVLLPGMSVGREGKSTLKLR